MTTVLFTLTGLNGESIPYTQFKVEAAAPDGVYDPEYVVPSPVTFTTDSLGQASVELTPTNAPYFITRMTGSVDDFIAYKFFVPESTNIVEANMLYVDLGKQLKLSTDRSLYALIEAKVAMLHALDMATTISNTVPSETIRTASSIAGARLLTGVGTGVSPRLQVLGYSDVGDGGGGVFIWNATSNAADNGVTILKPTAFTSESGRWIRDYTGAVNVKWFGAKGDGVTDDSAAFHAAFDFVGAYGGGQIDVPFGCGQTYAVNLTIANKRGIHLNGTNLSKQAARTPTFTMTDCLVASNNSNPILTIGDDFGTNADDQTSGTIISNITFCGKGTAAIGLKLKGGAYRNFYNNLSFVGFTTAAISIIAAASKTVFYQYFTGIGIHCTTAGAIGISVDGSSTGTTSTNVTSVYFDNGYIATMSDAASRGIYCHSAAIVLSNMYIQLAIDGIGIELRKSPLTAIPNVSCSQVTIDGDSVKPAIYVNIPNFTATDVKDLSRYIFGSFTCDGSVKLQDDNTNTMMVGKFGYVHKQLSYDPKVINTLCIANGVYPEYDGMYFAAGGGPNPILRAYAPNNFELVTGSLQFPGNVESPDVDDIASKVQFHKTLWVSTTSATPVRLTADGAVASSTNIPLVPVNSSVAFTGHVHARQSTTQDTDGESVMWTIQGLLTRNNAGAVSLVAAVTPTLVCQTAGAPAWSVAVTADDTLKGLNVTFTGAAGKNIHAVCSIILSEISYV